jgi:hypothetical protein
MDENLPRKASHRIPRNPEPVGRVPNPSSTPGQNDGISDGFLTMTPVDTSHSGQPGETTDPKNPMKSTIDQPSKGSPPSPRPRDKKYQMVSTHPKPPNGAPDKRVG